MAVRPIRRWKRTEHGFVGWAECPCGVLTKMPAERCAGCGTKFFPMTLGRRKVSDGEDLLLRILVDAR